MPDPPHFAHAPSPIDWLGPPGPSESQRTTMPFRPQQFGPYALKERIGIGGMAEIFLASGAEDEGFQVIKRILPTLSEDTEFVRMFDLEAKLCLKLRHPNIASVHDFGSERGQSYIAMDFIDGRDLLKTLAACGRSGRGFPTRVALFIATEVLSALHYAHTLTGPDGGPLGLIHRDVSPSNVLLSFGGEVKLVDFGIAKANAREKTRTGILKGKFGYMAPEQVAGIHTDHRADLFAVGILLYEMLTGQRLFYGPSDLAVLDQVREARVHRKPRALRPSIRPELEAVVLRSLAREADDRFDDARSFKRALEATISASDGSDAEAAGMLRRLLRSLFLEDPREQERRSQLGLAPHGPPGADDEATATDEEHTARGTASSSPFAEATVSRAGWRDQTGVLEPDEQLILDAPASWHSPPPSSPEAPDLALAMARQSEVTDGWRIPTASSPQASSPTPPPADATILDSGPRWHELATGPSPADADAATLGDRPSRETAGDFHVTGPGTGSALRPHIFDPERTADTFEGSATPTGPTDAREQPPSLDTDPTVFAPPPRGARPSPAHEPERKLVGADAPDAPHRPGASGRRPAAEITPRLPDPRRDDTTPKYPAREAAPQDATASATATTFVLLAVLVVILSAATAVYIYRHGERPPAAAATTAQDPN